MIEPSIDPGALAQLSKELEQLYTDERAPARRWVFKLVDSQAEGLADRFYEVMDRVQEAHGFLGNSIVSKNLKGSMAAWMREVFSDRELSSVPQLVERQRFVGAVHARINVPMNLVDRGMSVLKRAIWGCILAEQEAEVDRIDALVLVDELLDICRTLMNDAYLSDVLSNERDGQVLRMTMLGTNAEATLERMRVELQSFYNLVLSEVVASHESGENVRIPSILHSNLGLWTYHKAAILFADRPEIKRLIAQLQTIADVVDQLVASREQTERKGLFKTLRESIADGDWILKELAVALSDDEQRRDPLTNVFNRRFLGPILKRETELSAPGKRFGILMADIDHFKQLNDQHGHQGGDVALKKIADLISSTIRVGDFVFRYGGEEFLIILAAIDEQDGVRVAEKIRATVESTQLLLEDGVKVCITLSLGLAVHDGHPDFSRVVKAADQALYRAKEGGRNQVVLAG